MKRLSTDVAMYRIMVPLFYLMGYGLILIVSHGEAAGVGVIVAGMLGYTIWSSRRLSDVWLDGDGVEVKGPASGSFRVPLADVSVLEVRRGRGPGTILLGLDHPAGKTREVRFIPANNGVEKDLEERIHAARAARKS